ncbi:MAG TPA: hypothetical protein VF824_17980 [Thermoanaerobaculia bacterium]
MRTRWLLVLITIVTLRCASSGMTTSPPPTSAEPPPTAALPPLPLPTTTVPATTTTTIETATAVFEPAWAVWPTGAPEPSGFGLYSYVLIRDVPQNADEIDTALHVIERLLHVADDLPTALANNPRSELNVFFFPTTAAPAVGKDRKELARWILAHYNHARARRILDRLGETRRGPYFVTALTPLGDSPKAGQAGCVQVLTRTRRAYLADWVDYFVQSASRPRTWDEATLQKMLMETRDHLEVVGVVVPAIVDDVKKIAKWFSVK